MNDSFNNAVAGNQQAQQPPQQDIATKAERDMLAEARATPAPVLTLQPDAPEIAQIDSAIEQAREQRIHYLDHRLDHAQGRFADGIEQSF